MFVVETTKEKKKEESRITWSITRKKQSFHRLFMTLFEFLVPDESVSFHDKILKVKINYTSCNSGDIVSNTIKYQHGTIKKTGTQTVINKGASMINELSRGPILMMSLKRSSLLLAVDAYVIHGLLCIHFVGVLHFLSRRIWLVYSWQFYSICAAQNERTNWRELEEIIIRSLEIYFELDWLE